VRYRIEISPAARRALRRVDQRNALRLQAAIALLARDPRPPASRPLRSKPAYRLRVGDYRVVYTIDDGVLVILVLIVGHRREVYRNLDQS
jgi:mRNA interferase RelE/StbE